jgi:hypothetical protein
MRKSFSILLPALKKGRVRVETGEGTALANKMKNKIPKIDGNGKSRTMLISKFDQRRAEWTGQSSLHPPPTHLFLARTYGHPACRRHRITLTKEQSATWENIVAGFLFILLGIVFSSKILLYSLV